MSSVPLHKVSDPVRATEFKFLRTQSLPTIMVLEVYTEANPLRIGLIKSSLLNLPAWLKLLPRNARRYRYQLSLVPASLGYSAFSPGRANQSLVRSWLKRERAGKSA